MGINRRRVLAGLGSMSAGLAYGPAFAVQPIRYVSAFADSDGYGLAILCSTGNLIGSHRLPSRGHGSALSPDGGILVHFARRPGAFALALNLSNRTATKLIEPPANRLFYGHGFFSRDGRVLYATENDFDGERGVLGMYDTRDGFRRLGEISTGGVGPHEAILLRNGRVAAIANGGIATHPDFPRLKLNISDMAPNLALIDLETGHTISAERLPPHLHQVSLRHLAEDADGRIWMGGQFEGAPNQDVPLIHVYTRTDGISPLRDDDIPYRSMKQYVGSISVSVSGMEVAVTSPRGGVWMVFDAETQRLLRSGVIDDVSGVAPGTTGFVMADGNGVFRDERQALWAHRGLSLDNHLTRIE